MLTLGTQDAVEQLRSALGVGCSAAVLIEADPAGYGPADVAREIAAVVEQGDGRPTTWCCSATTPRTPATSRSASGSRTRWAGRWSTGWGRSRSTAASATARGTGPDGVETYAVPLPAVVTVLEGGVEPRYPTITGRMKAKKAKIEIVAPQAEPHGSGRVRLTLPPAQPSTVEVLGQGPDTAAAVVDLLQKLGVAR